MEDEVDLYVVLGLEGGLEVSQADVRKAYRTRALIWHPDKQSGKKAADVSAAAIEFEKIQKAHEVLGDEKARKVYDELWKLRKSREEKEKQLSFKRQKMMQDLREREGAFETERAHKREEVLAWTRLQAEITRIRVKKFKRQHSSGLEFSFDSRSSTAQAKEQAAAAAPTTAQATEMKSTLKASWISTDGGAGGYTATRLKEIFQEFGEVEDVVIRQSKFKGKSSALVVMKSSEAAIAATEGPCGDHSNPLLVALLVPPREPLVKSHTTPGNVAGPNPVVGSNYKVYENDVLRKLRQAGERSRLMKQMQDEDSKAT